MSGFRGLVRKVHRRALWQVFGICGAILLPASSAQAQQGADETSRIEQTAQDFFDAAHAFDFDAMRAGATSDFEMLYDGRRMTLDDFIGMLQGMEEAREGRVIPTYTAQGMNTEVVGDAAYTTWASPNGRWFETMILIRSGERWLIDRAFTMRRAQSTR